jgi:serine/threonine protein kinase
VMVTRDGEVRIIDFGLANHLDLPDFIYESFKEPKGSPAYIAPEQFFGVRDEPRSDVYSIGTMLYEMTTAKLPFPDANSMLEVINRIKGGVLSPRQFMPALSESFATLVLTCLQNMPDRRFASMDALYLALDKIEPAAASVSVPPKAVQTRPPSLSGGKLLGQVTGKFRAILGSAEGDKLAEIKTWIARHQAGRTPRYRIVAAYDCASDERTTALNRDILAHAIRQSRLQPSIITLLTVLTDHNAAVTSTGRQRKELNAAYLEAREAITRVIGKSARNDLPISINIRSGDPVDAIVGCVADYKADLLVIGARKRSMLSRFALGSTAYKVLTTIKCPVIVIQENEGDRSKAHDSSAHIPEVRTS